jgi:hypothetical protein
MGSQLGPKWCCLLWYSGGGVKAWARIASPVGRIESRFLQTYDEMDRGINRIKKHWFGSGEGLRTRSPHETSS